VIGTARPAPTIAPIPSAIGGSSIASYLGNPDADTPITVTYPWMATPGTPIGLRDPRLATPAVMASNPTGPSAPTSPPAFASVGSSGSRPSSGTFGIATPTPVGSGDPDPSGSWNGMTSQGRPISFTVSGDAITSISVGYSITGCVSQQGTVNLQFNQPNSVAPGITPENTFFVMTPPSTGMGIGFVQGTFTSPTSATGTLKMSLISLGAFDPSGSPCAPGAEATWTAGKG
jgi:hypothetical protein